jgi:NAD(P)-dependent dehydrogenase (short-subunit alcohol dehydrogenase family)
MTSSWVRSGGAGLVRLWYRYLTISLLKVFFHLEHATENLFTPIAALLPPSPNVLVVGGTAGIGAALARKLALELPVTSHVTIAGRNGDAAADIIASVRQQAKFAGQDDSKAQNASFDFQKVDCASMSDVKRFCEQYRQQLHKRDGTLDILILTPGILSIKGRTPATPNSTIDQKMALHYYARMLIIRELGPILSKNVIVMSVLDGKYANAHDRSVLWDDLSLSRPGHYGLRSARTHGNAMTDIMMQYFASSSTLENEEGHSSTFIHAYPGFVSTTTFDNPALPFVVRLGLRLLMRLFATSPSECADRLAEGMVKAHRSTIADRGLAGRWYGLDRQNIVDKRPVDSAVVERIRAHTWQVVDGQAAGA